MNYLQELKQKEKFFFDTYKSKKANLEKAEHLEKMAAIIREINELELKLNSKKKK